MFTVPYKRIWGEQGCVVPPANSLPLFLTRFRAILLILLVASAVALAFALDRRVDAFFLAIPHGAPAKNVAVLMGKYADWTFLLLYAFLFFIAGVVRKSRRWKTLAIGMALSCLLTGMTSTAIRSVSGRTRPGAEVTQGWYGVRNNSQWLIGNRDYNSFPSGHVGAAAGFVVPLILATRRGKIPAILFCALLAFSRLLSSSHHLSDVTVAAVIGAAGGYFMWRFVMPRYVEPWLDRRPRPAAVPVTGAVETLPAFD
jgi:membrane-associated phospholipid phosphatase